MTDRPGARFPGNANAIDGEVRRLRALRDHLESTGDQVRRLSIDGWDGAAYESFEQFRLAFRDRWYVVADLHGEAARHLERYHQTLLELRRRAATADPVLGGVGPAGSDQLDDLARWRGQLDSEARDAARAIRAAARALDSLPALLPEEPAVAPAPPPARPPHPAPAPDHNLNPRMAHADPRQFRDHVRALCDEIATATLITAS